MSGHTQLLVGHGPSRPATKNQRQPHAHPRERDRRDILEPFPFPSPLSRKFFKLPVYTGEFIHFKSRNQLSLTVTSIRFSVLWDRSDLSPPPFYAPSSLSYFPLSFNSSLHVLSPSFLIFIPTLLNPALPFAF